MQNTENQKIDEILQAQRHYFRTGETLEVNFRKQMLKRLYDALDKWKPQLMEALWTDLHKSYEEAYMTEISMIKGEIKEAYKHLKKWVKRERVHSPMTILGSKSYVVKEPLGMALIVSPWNYPVQLLLSPLVGAIASGCTAVLKPSPYVPHVSKVIESLINDTYDNKYIAVVQGNRDVNKYLFAQRFDLIFFTGSPALAKKVSEAAAKYLTPVVLELGGKSPCIVDKTADVKLAAKRIAWGKTLNSGQTCIAPDYILIHKDVKSQFIEEFKKSVILLHTENVQESSHYVRMVTDKAFARVSGYLSNGKVICGGKIDASERFIEPTLLDDVPLDAPIMQEEIFGPIFPLITFDEEHDSFSNQVINFIVEREKPLAFYYFGNEKEGWNIIKHTSSGGGCINDTIMHVVNDKVPFGGVGNSGMGSYHGKLTFDAFTHRRSIIVTPTWFDIPLRYMPYKFFDIIKRVI